MLAVAVSVLILPHRTMMHHDEISSMDDLDLDCDFDCVISSENHPPHCDCVSYLCVVSSISSPTSSVVKSIAASAADVGVGARFGAVVNEGKEEALTGNEEAGT